jgi:hypothetical protein
VFAPLATPGKLSDVSRPHELVDDRMQVVPPNLTTLLIASGGFASSSSDHGRFRTLLARGARSTTVVCSHKRR